ncbi:MAG: TonB-dependent receptor [Bacteroidota bacterium]
MTFVSKITHTFLFITLVCFLQAQSGAIKGKIASDDGPLGFANIALKNAADSSVVKYEVSEDDGTFVFKGIKYGKYFIQTTYVGMVDFQSEPFTFQEALLDLEAFTLQTVSSDLEAVEVVAQKPMIEIKADRTVFNVQNTLNATGSDGFELLRKAPGVIVDNNNNIILDGKTGVLIYINGKPSPLNGDDLTNFLQTLQSSDIEAIELITQPSSKYDAAGNAGIINIKLKKDKSLGTNGTLVAGYTYGRNSRYNSSVSLNSRTSGSNFYGSFSNNFGKSWSFINLDRYQGNVQYDSETEAINDNNASNVRLGYDLFANDKNTFGILLNGSFFNNTNNGFTNTPIIPFGDDVAEQTLVANSINQGDNYNINGNINYRYADTLGREFTADVDYGRYSRDRNNFQPNQYIDNFTGTVLFERNSRMITPTDIDIFTVKLDYSQRALGGQLGVGVKYSLVETDNTFDFYDVIQNQDNFNAERSNQFLYDENVNAAYINFNKKWKKWNLQLGLRAEQTISEGDLISLQQNEENNVKRNYLDWFPSGGLTYNPSYKNSWALTYSRRIQRPNYQTLNPFEAQIDELSFSKGNPFLQPQYTNNIKLSNTYKYRLTTSISYSFISDFFAQVTDTLGSNRNFLQTRNIANQQVLNIGVSYPFSPTKWWSVYMSVNAFRSSYDGQDDKFTSIDQNTLSLYASNTFSLPKGFKFEVSGWYNSPSVWGGTYLTRSMGALNLALQKKFMNDRLTARLAVNDIFFSSFWRADMTFGELFIDGSGGWESRNVRFNLNYSFGSKEIKSNRKRKTGLESEEGRVGN